MLCYECATQGVRREAVGICRHCSAGVCEEHARVEASPVKAERRNKTFGAVRWKIEQARPARRMLCAICQSALRQEECESEVEHGTAAEPARQSRATLHSSAA